MKQWYNEAFIYHIYPIGFCGAPSSNDYNSVPVPRIEKVLAWLEHFKALGVNAIYLGPIFESSSHGYDTTDYYNVDRRLGRNETFAEVSHALHEAGIRVVLDGVFNHIGRDFPMFKDVLLNKAASRYCNWFSGINFNGTSPYGDPFSYDSWNGYYNLVKLNLKNNEVKDHIFSAIDLWIKYFDIDGLRLDCADCLDGDFLRDLKSFCKNIKPDFWLLGEVIHGDYRKWANSDMLDSVTNYECYKGLYSSHNDINLFEIAYSFNRQFNNESGLYKGMYLYSFADNHDVTRVSSILKNKEHLKTLYALLFTMPGIPSIYYGSEWGIEARKNSNSDDELLRPSIDLASTEKEGPFPELKKIIRQFAWIRKNSNALMHGGYKQMIVKHEQLVFARTSIDENVIVVINTSGAPAFLNFNLPCQGSKLYDMLNGDKVYYTKGNSCCTIDCPPYWARILKVE